MTDAERAIYLQSPEWKARRKEHLAAADRRCQLCNTDRGRLELHHRTYVRLGHEDFADLIVLCFKCHRMFHERRGRADQGRSERAIVDVAAKKEIAKAERKRRRALKQAKEQKAGVHVAVGGPVLSRSEAAQGNTWKQRHWRADAARRHADRRKAQEAVGIAG